MNRIIVPAILVIAGIGLFVAYTNPTYQRTKALESQRAAYDDALTKSQQLRSERDKLLSKRNTFPADGIQKLERMVPDNVDNIRLIIDINNIAARHGLSLKNVALGTVSDSSTPRSALAAGASGDALGSVDLGFGLAASYDDFLAFLLDLEHSLRIVDVEKISFRTGTSNLYDFTVSIRTYWLH